MNTREAKNQSTNQRVLIVALTGINYSTRARKAARFLKADNTVEYYALASAGRTGPVDRHGLFKSGSVRVRHVRTLPRRTSASTFSKLYNLIVAYAPAFLVLFVLSAGRRADIVVVTSPHLALVALAHRLFWRSRIVVDVAERPGLVSARGSLAASFRFLEPLLLRLLARAGTVATPAVPSDSEYLRRLGFRRVIPVRNAPLLNWRAPYRDPTGGDALNCSVIGSIFPGRGYEMLIRAVSECERRGVDVHVKIFGPCAPDYLRVLKDLAREYNAEKRIEWSGSISISEVSDAYLDGDIGLVLYEGSDPGNDGLSNKILECVSSGRPVLAGSLPENTAFVEPNELGWVCEMTVDGIAEGLERIWKSGVSSEMCLRCRNFGERELVWEREYARVLPATRG